MALHMSLSSAHKQQVRSGVGAVWEAGMFREAMKPSVRMAPSPDIALSLVQPLGLPSRPGVTLGGFSQPLLGVCVAGVSWGE